MAKTKNAIMKAKFRASKEWKDFRHQMNVLFEGKDFITGKKLVKGFNVHHLDDRAENYKNLDETRFIPLNPATHDYVHTIYRVWHKDKSMLKRLETVLQKMEECSND